MKNTKTKLISSVAVLLICFAMLIGSTFAWFTDSASTGVNKIQAGNLDIEVKHTNSYVTAPVTIEGTTELFRDKDGQEIKWEPGAMSWETFEIKNAGNLALKYTLSTNILDYNTVSGSDNSLLDVLKVIVLEDSNIVPTRENVSGLGWDSAQKLNDFTKENAKLESNGDTDKFTVVVYWEPTDHDNNYNLNNGQTSSDNTPYLYVNFGIKVLASQLDYETDSFDNSYDKNATYGETVTTTINSGENTTLVSSATPSNVAGNTTTVVFPSSIKELADNNGLTMTLDVEASPVLTANSKFVVGTDGAVGAIDLTAKVGNDTVSEFKDSTGNSVPVTVTTYVAKNLSGVTLQYGNETWERVNNESEVTTNKFYYNSDTGKIVFGTTHFSTFVLSASEAVYLQENNSAYMNLNDAISADINSNTEHNIKLLKNTTIDSPITVTDDKYLDIDLRGYTVFNKSSEYVGFLLRNATLNIDNGKIIDDNENSSFSIYGSDSPDVGYKTSLIVGQNLNISGGETDIWIAPDISNSCYGVTVDIYGSISGNQPVYVSGNIHNLENPVKINIHSSANIIDTDDGSWESSGTLYLGGYAETTIDDEAQITSENLNVIGVAAGKLIINGGNLIGGDTVGSIPSGGGSIPSDTSYAVFVLQHGTNLPIEVVINGGTFKAAGALKQKNGEGDNTSVKIQINDGDFIRNFNGKNLDGTVAEEPKLVSTEKVDILKITGGTFDDDPSDYVDKNNYDVDQNNSRYTVISKNS